MLNQKQLHQAVQLNSLRNFARERAISEEVVISAYERELYRLRDGAHVEQFLGIRAEKHAKDALRIKEKST